MKMFATSSDRAKSGTWDCQGLQILVYGLKFNTIPSKFCCHSWIHPQTLKCEVYEITNSNFPLLCARMVHMSLMSRAAVMKATRAPSCVSQSAENSSTDQLQREVPFICSGADDHLAHRLPSDVHAGDKAEGETRVVLRLGVRPRLGSHHLPVRRRHPASRGQGKRRSILQRKNLLRTRRNGRVKGTEQRMLPDKVFHFAAEVTERNLRLEGLHCSPI